MFISQQRFYFDANATRPIKKESLRVMIELMEKRMPLNPSSHHAEGKYAFYLVETARNQVAHVFSCPPRHVTFTSGATEANHLAIFAACTIHQCHTILVTATDHVSIIENAYLAKRLGLVKNVCVVCVDGNGLIKEHDLQKKITTLDGKKFVLTCTLVNNETGVIQPITTIVDTVHSMGGMIICDSVQALGKYDEPLAFLSKTDFFTVSSHKIGGPQGVGALITPHEFQGCINGGGQENKRRAGTENVISIAGFGCACQLLSMENNISDKHRKKLRDDFEKEVQYLADKHGCDIEFFSREKKRVWNTSAFSIKKIKSDVMLMMLDMHDVAIGSGSACSSSMRQNLSSHVLQAMGVTKEETESFVRVSFYEDHTKEDISYLLNAFDNILAKNKKERIILKKSAPGF